MVRIIFLSAVWILASAAFAQEHRHHGAHEHGAASLGVVVEGNTVHFEFEAPADNIIGFEHEPKTPQDRAKQKAALDKLKNNLPAILKLQPASGCRLIVEKLAWKKEMHGGSGTHSIVEGEFKAECKNSPAGTELRTAFTQFFPSLESVRITVISGNRQNAVVIHKDKGSAEL